MIVAIILGKQILKVDDGYLDEPLDTLFPLYDEDDNEVGRLEAKVLQLSAIKVPACFAETYKTKTTIAVEKALGEIDIHVVMRLVVHNNEYINYLISPVLMETIINREGGLYFAFVTIDDKDILYAGNTAKELEQAIKNDIRACNSNVLVIHDKYFEEALNKLLEMHKANDTCQKPYFYTTYKSPKSTVAEPGEEEACHDLHCQWCLEMGLDGKHGNMWATDGNTYVHPECKTTHSHYGRVNKDCK